MAAALACCGTGALAEDWRVVSVSDTGIGYIDADTVRRDGSAVSFSGTVYYVDPPTDMIRSTTRYQGDCAQMSARATEMTAFLRDGRRESWPIDEAPEPVRPGSNLHGFVRAACEGVWPGGTVADIDAHAAAALRELRGK